MGNGGMKRVAYVPEIEQRPELRVLLERVIGMADRFPAVEFTLRQSLGVRADVLEAEAERALGQSIKAINMDGMEVGPAGFVFDADRRK